MSPLKVYRVTNDPFVPQQVADDLRQGAVNLSGRQASVVVVAKSQVEASRMLDLAKVTHAARDVVLVRDGDEGGVVGLLSAAGQLGSRRVLAYRSISSSSRVVRIDGGGLRLVGWVVSNPGAFVSAEEVTLAEIHALSRVLTGRPGGVGRTEEALRVLAAGYRRVDLDETGAVEAIEQVVADTPSPKDAGLALWGAGYRRIGGQR